MEEDGTAGGSRKKYVSQVTLNYSDCHWIRQLKILPTICQIVTKKLAISITK